MIVPQLALRRYIHALRNASVMNVLGRDFEIDSMTNITPSISSRLNRKLLSQPNSPLALLWRRIQRYFEKSQSGMFSFLRHDDPIVTVEQNFDELLIPPSHPSRTHTDSYYLNRRYMLRTHMTAHEREVMATGRKSFLLIGDVYRRDEIDSCHMPVFHQMEGVRIFTPDELLIREADYSPIVRQIERLLADEPLPSEYEPRIVKLALADLYMTLNGLMQDLFGDNSSFGWQRTDFPFTQPSVEAEVNYDGTLLEVFGSGILQRQVLHPSVIEKNSNAIGWAFGMGMERVAMALNGIPDIRLFWSEDPRFTNQFSAPDEDGNPIKFVPFSKYPPITRDISFYISEKREFQPNEFYELIREVSPDLVESVQLVDEYHDPKRSQTSLCFKIVYRAMDRTLTDDFVNELQMELRRRVSDQLLVQLR